MTIKIVIADDHNVVRQGLVSYLALDSDLEVIGFASNGVEAVELARRLKPDIVLMDLLMPEMDGFAATAEIKRDVPETKVVALTSINEEGAITRALQAGVSGFLLKQLEAEDLHRAIKSVAAGQVLLAPQVARVLAERPLQPAPRQTAESLTDREVEVLKLLAAGKANKEIAQLLQLSDKTVKVHVSIILAKLGMQSRTQAAVFATRLGLTPSAGAARAS